MFRLQKDKPFLVLGRAGMDLYADPPGTRIQEASKFTTALGGSAANTAVALVKQGCTAALVTAVSDDAIGRFVLHQLSHYCIGVSHVQTIGGEARNSLAVVETRAVDTQSVIYRNGAADFELDEAMVAKISFETYSSLIFSGTALAKEPSRSATHMAISKSKRAGLVVIMDIDHRPYSWKSASDAADAYLAAAQLCDVVVGNDEEFAVLARGADGLALAHMLAKPNRLVIYKMGERGSITLQGDTKFETPIFKVGALKPTGAGDAFMGGLLAALAGGFTLEAAVRRGAATAALVVGRVGCAPAMPTAAEVEKFMMLRNQEA